MLSLCREYQVDWLAEKIKMFVIKIAFMDTDEILKYLVLSEEMDFGKSFDEALINALSDSFVSIRMKAKFKSLSLTTQIMIVRKRLWLHLRAFNVVSRDHILNMKDIGFLSIFEGQPVIKFADNAFEQKYIKRFQKEGK